MDTSDQHRFVVDLEHAGQLNHARGHPLDQGEADRLANLLGVKFLPSRDSEESFRLWVDTAGSGHWSCSTG